MGWQDRDYSRNYRGNGGALSWFLYGQVPLFRVFGIDVRAHSSLVIMAVIGLVFGLGEGFNWQDRLESVVALFLIILLHEFGHCFACRRVGGEADEIIMHPLGGLALCAPPRRPLPSFITVAGGPAVNVLICVVCGIVLLVTIGQLPWNPFAYYPLRLHGSSQTIRTLVIYTYWIYQMSFSLLVFNLMPIFPLDGGQMLQTILWPRMGYGRSMKLSTEIGMFAAVAGAAFALSVFNIGLAVLAGLGFYYCYTMRQQLLANSMDAYDEAVSYSAAIPKVKVQKKSWLEARRERKAQESEVAEAKAVDLILEKVAKSGMHSLSNSEKRTLAKASENQRKRDAARAKRY